MANALYGKFKQALLNKEVDLNSDNLGVVAVASGYTPNLASDDFLDDISGGDIVATFSPLLSPTILLGVFDAADFTFPTVTGSQIVRLVIFHDTGTPSTSHLIGVIDTAANLPKTPDGTDIDIVWDNGANKIFKL